MELFVRNLRRMLLLAGTVGAAVLLQAEPTRASDHCQPLHGTGGCVSCDWVGGGWAFFCPEGGPSGGVDGCQI